MGRVTDFVTIPSDSGLFKLLSRFVDAYSKRTEQWSESADGNSILIAINDLSRKVDEFMATQEERLRAMVGQIATVQEGVDRLQSEFEAFKASNPQLEDEIAGLEAAIGALASDVAAPAPTPEPTPNTGTGDTGGTEGGGTTA